MSAYSEFFLYSKASIAQLECLEVSHSLWSQTYRFVRNATNGVTVTHEDAVAYEYVYYPAEMSLSGPRDDLDHVLTVQLGDLGEIIPMELDAVVEDGTYEELPVVKYRVYRSDDLENILYGPIVLEVKTFTFTREGAAFEAKAPSLNVAKTGERFTIARFPMLKGLL